jgi:plasmid stability protein
MATLHVRNVPDELYELLRERADANGRSIGAETTMLVAQQLTGRSGSRIGRRRRFTREGLFVRFTEQARAAVVAAADEARTLGHEHVGSEHLVLGLLRTDGAAANALSALGLDLERARQAVEERLGRGETATIGPIRFAPEAKQGLELARRESRALGCQYVGTEHLLLGIVAQPESAGAELVRAAEDDAEKVRMTIHRSAAAGAVHAPADPAPFRVLELAGSSEEWEAQLNGADAAGYELLEIVERRAILKLL